MAISVGNPKIIPPPCILWVPLGIGNGAGGQKTRMMGLPDRQRSLTISSAVWIQCTNVTDGDRRDRETDRQTAKTALTHNAAW